MNTKAKPVASKKMKEDEEEDYDYGDETNNDD